MQESFESFPKRSRRPKQNTCQVRRKPGMKPGMKPTMTPSGNLKAAEPKSGAVKTPHSLTCSPRLSAKTKLPCAVGSPTAGSRCWSPRKRKQTRERSQNRLWKACRRSEQNVLCRRFHRRAAVKRHGAKREASHRRLSNAFGVGCDGRRLGGERRSARSCAGTRASSRNVYLPLPAAVSHRGKTADRRSPQICRARRRRSGTARPSRHSQAAIRTGEAGYPGDALQLAAGFRENAPELGENSRIARADSYRRRRTFPRSPFLCRETFRARHRENKRAATFGDRAAGARQRGCHASAPTYRTGKASWFAVVAG